MEEKGEKERDLSRVKKTVTVLVTIGAVFTLGAVGLLIVALIIGNMELLLVTAALAVCGGISFSSARRTKLLRERMDRHQSP